MRYVDAGLSGTLLERPSLARLRADVAAGRIALVVCYDPDRLSRNLGHLLLLVDEFRRHGADVEFTNFDMAQSADGRLLFAMRGAIAEFETHKIRQRMTAGKIARAREGRPVGGGHTIYGYVYDRTNRRFLADPAEAAVVAHIFRLAEEHGTYAIAARLNAAGVPAKHGGRWSQTSVYGILRNRTYLGRMPQMGGLGHVAVPPLVREEAFERVAAVVTARRNRPRGRATHPYLLTGHIRCGVCGRRMGGGYGRLRGGAYRTRYACSGKRSQPACASAYYASDKVDDAVWRCLVGGLLAGRASKTVADRLQARLDLSSTPTAAPAPRSGVERQRDRLLVAYRNGLLDAQALAGQLRALEAAESLEATRPLPTGGASTAVATVQSVLERARAAETLDERRFVIEALGVVLVLGPGGEGRLQLATPASPG